MLRASLLPLVSELAALDADPHGVGVTDGFGAALREGDGLGLAVFDALGVGVGLGGSLRLTTSVTKVPRAGSVPAGMRLIVRRVRRLNPATVPDGQGELFAAYRHHAFHTTNPLVIDQTEPMHRQHAVIEQIFADLEDGPLAPERAVAPVETAAAPVEPEAREDDPRAESPEARPRRYPVSFPRTTPSSLPAPPGTINCT